MPLQAHSILFTRAIDSPHLRIHLLNSEGETFAVGHINPHDITSIILQLNLLYDDTIRHFPEILAPAPRRSRHS